MESRFISVLFREHTHKWFGWVRPSPAEKAGLLLEHLEVGAHLHTDSHEDEENAARAVDK